MEQVQVFAMKGPARGIIWWTHRKKDLWWSTPAVPFLPFCPFFCQFYYSFSLTFWNFGTVGTENTEGADCRISFHAWQMIAKLPFMLDLGNLSPICSKVQCRTQALDQDCSKGGGTLLTILDDIYESWLGGCFVSIDYLWMGRRGGGGWNGGILLYVTQ